MKRQVLTLGTALALILAGAPAMAQDSAGAAASANTGATASSEGTTDATETPTTDATETPTTDNTTTATSTGAPGDIQTSAESSGNVAVELNRSPNLDTSSPSLDTSSPTLGNRTQLNTSTELESNILNEGSNEITATSGTLVDENDGAMTDEISNSQNALRAKIGETQAELDAKIEDARSGASTTPTQAGSARIQDLTETNDTGVRASATTNVDVQ